VSDHCAIKIELKNSGALQGPHRARPFRYENMWRRHPSYKDTISSSWANGCRSLSDVHGNLGDLQSVLRQWDRDVFASVRNELRGLRRGMDELRHQSVRRGPTREECEIAKCIAKLLAREEVMEK
jgi:hypothetical protein